MKPRLDDTIYEKTSKKIGRLDWNNIKCPAKSQPTTQLNNKIGQLDMDITPLNSTNNLGL
jgi:hypothetical protein